MSSSSLTKPLPSPVSTPPDAADYLEAVRVHCVILHSLASDVERKADSIIEMIDRLSGNYDKPLALAPPAEAVATVQVMPQSTEGDVEYQAAVQDDPLPDTPNTARDNEAHADLDREIKQCILDAGGNEQSWEEYKAKKDLDNKTLGWKQKLIQEMRKKLAKAQPKSVKPEPASGYAAQREDGARKVLRPNESGQLEAVWEAPVEAAETPVNKLKAAMDEVIAEHWPNTPDGFNEGYKVTRAKIAALIGDFRNFDEVSAADQAKAIAMLSRWNPADDVQPETKKGSKRK